MLLGTTPMFKQYHTIKDNYQDAILFYRLGDFYEMFGPDAECASKILGLALTARDGGGGTKVPMCGVPFHSADSYIAKLVKAGHKVAICEQIEDPKTVKGLVGREVIRVITPGMVLDDTVLKKDSNYIVSIARKNNQAAIAVADASTGEFFANETTTLEQAFNEIDRYHPVEIIYDEDDTAIKEELRAYGLDTRIQINAHFAHTFFLSDAADILKNHFSVQSLAVYGYESEKRQGLSLSAAGALLDYIRTMQKHTPLNITHFFFYRIDDRMILDRATRRNLELNHSLSYDDRAPSLFDVLDHTETAFGRRLLRNWLEHPLTKETDIHERLNATEEFYIEHGIRENLQLLLAEVYDLERIVSRISYRSANAKDLLALKQSLSHLPAIKEVLKDLSSTTLKYINDHFDVLSDVHRFLALSINDNAPFSLREGGLIKNGWNTEVDELRTYVDEGESWLNDFELREKERTGIKNLKIGYNKVFGYYIDVTKSHLSKVPADYHRKQTLANSERYITDELKQMEQKVVGAAERLKDLEYELFVSVLSKLQEYIPRILKTSHHLAILDVHMGLAVCAIENRYSKPDIVHDGIIIKGLRHPIVEQTLKNYGYVANDVVFRSEDARYIILTGPNMSGKSTYCRSIALASIMMQIGSFIPASSAQMAVVDRVFARIGANDQLASGQSTFMVEMNEVSNILNNATSNSLIVLDEVGRGTSTYDGVSIAYAITRYINTYIGAFTIFATHYHELTTLAEEEQGILNYSVAVEEHNQDIVFMHTIIPGPADRSYGIHVAKMAGLSSSVLNLAKNVLEDLEEKRDKGPIEINKEELQLKTELEKYKQFITSIANTNISSLSIGDLLDRSIELQEKAKNLLER